MMRRNLCKATKTVRVFSDLGCEVFAGVEKSNKDNRIYLAYQSRPGSRSSENLRRCSTHEAKYLIGKRITLLGVFSVTHCFAQTGDEGLRIG